VSCGVTKRKKGEAGLFIMSADRSAPVSAAGLAAVGPLGQGPGGDPRPKPTETTTVVATMTSADLYWRSTGAWAGLVVPKQPCGSQLGVPPEARQYGRSRPGL
jgi:hypothetical protein